MSPLFIVEASITGEANEGATLTADPGLVIGDPEPDEDGQWFECLGP